MSAALFGLLAAALYLLSEAAFFAFFFGARLTHSVPVARAFDAAGSVFLLPGRLALRNTPAFMVVFPSVIVPANTAAWLVLFCFALLFRNARRRKSS